MQSCGNLERRQQSSVVDIPHENCQEITGSKHKKIVKEKIVRNKIFREFPGKTWPFLKSFWKPKNLWSNSVTRQVNFNMTKIDEK